MINRNIPDIVVGRLPRYLLTLQQMATAGQQTTSSKELGDKMGYSAAQIRKDLSQFGEFGKQGTGYDIAFLIRQLKEILHLEKVWEIALVGAGDLGHAIARYQGFLNRGFVVKIVFDNDPEKVGKKIGDYQIHHTSELTEKIKQQRIKIAMLTVPASVAQSVAEALVKAGVTAILTYAPMILNLPPHVHVQYIDPILQIQHMTYYLED